MDEKKFYQLLRKTIRSKKISIGRISGDTAISVYRLCMFLDGEAKVTESEMRIVLDVLGYKEDPPPPEKKEKPKALFGEDERCEDCGQKKNRNPLKGSLLFCMTCKKRWDILERKRKINGKRKRAVK